MRAEILFSRLLDIIIVSRDIIQECLAGNGQQQEQISKYGWIVSNKEKTFDLTNLVRLRSEPWPPFIWNDLIARRTSRVSITSIFSPRCSETGLWFAAGDGSVPTGARSRTGFLPCLKPKWHTRAQWRVNFGVAIRADNRNGSTTLVFRMNGYHRDKAGRGG